MDFFGMVVFFGIVSGFCCAFIANAKGREGAAWFFLGLIFGLFALVVIAAVPSLKDNRQ
jgi:hypothetical protein